MHVTPRARRRACGAPLVAGLAVAAMASAPAALAAKGPVATGTSYGGSTSQDDPVTVAVAPGGRSIRSIDAFVTAKCDDGKGLTYSEPARFVPEAPPAVS